jgi:hypothetical protein
VQSKGIVTEMRKKSEKKMFDCVFTSGRLKNPSVLSGGGSVGKRKIGKKFCKLMQVE